MPLPQVREPGRADDARPWEGDHDLAPESASETGSQSGIALRGDGLARRARSSGSILGLGVGRGGAAFDAVGVVGVVSVG